MIRLNGYFGALTVPLFLLTLFSFAEDRALKPDLVVGGFGSAKGEFRRPGTILADRDRIIILDIGNNRIQVFSRNGKYLKEKSLKEVGLFNPLSMCLGRGGSIFVSGREEKSVLELNDSLFLSTRIEAPWGYMTQSASGILYILENEQLRLWRYSLLRRKPEVLPVPPLTDSPRPVSISIVRGQIWLLLENAILQTDSFGAITGKHSLPSRKPSERMVMSNGDQTLLIIGNRIYDMGKGRLEVHSVIPSGISVGGAAIAGSHLWVSDATSGKIFRFPFANN